MRFRFMRMRALICALQSIPVLYAEFFSTQKKTTAHGCNTNIFLKGVKEQITNYQDVRQYFNVSDPPNLYYGNKKHDNGNCTFPCRDFWWALYNSNSNSNSKASQVPRLSHCKHVGFANNFWENFVDRYTPVNFKGTLLSSDRNTILYTIYAALARYLPHNALKAFAQDDEYVIKYYKTPALLPKNTVTEWENELKRAKQMQLENSIPPAYKSS